MSDQPAPAALLVLRWVWRKPCPVCEEPLWATTTLGLYERVRPGCPVWFHRRDRARWTLGARRFPTSTGTRRRSEAVLVARQTAAFVAGMFIGIGVYFLSVALGADEYLAGGLGGGTGAYCTSRLQRLVKHQSGKGDAHV